MEISCWEIALGIVYCIVVGPPIYAYHLISRFYKRQVRAIKARTPLLPSEERNRQARSDINNAHPFTRLPGELRNRIYSYSMISGTVIDPIWGALYSVRESTSTEGETELCLGPSHHAGGYISRLYYKDKYDPYEITWSKTANLSQVCRAWRVEALKHFYGNNIFKLPIGEHLHRRTKPARSPWYLTWPAWLSWYWQHKASSQPAGKFASRMHYVHWLQKRPREAFAVMRLLLHDYRRCPHFVRQHSLQSFQGSCLIMVDFQGQKVRAVRGEKSHKDYFNLWDCEICWAQFVANVDRLNRSEEVVGLFADMIRKKDAERAIEVVDGVRRNLERQYDAKARKGERRCATA